MLKMFGNNKLILITFVICLGSFCVNAGFNPEEKAAMWKDIRPHIMKCAKADLSIQQVAELKKNDPETFVCKYECFLKSIGVLDDEYIFYPEKMAELAKKYIKNPDKAAKFETTLKDCAEVIDKEFKEGDGECMKAKLLLKCLAAHREEELLSQ